MNGKFGRFFDKFILLIQLLLSGFFCYLVRELLPLKYLGILAGVLLLLWIFVWLILRRKPTPQKPKRRGKYFGRFVSLILSIALALGDIMVYQGIDVLKSLTGLDYETAVYSVIVLDDSDYQEISDIDGKSLGLTLALDPDHVTSTIEKIQEQEEITVDQVEYSTIFELSSALLDGKVDAMLLNEGYRGLIQEINEDFESDTRVLYTFEIKEKIEDDDPTEAVKSITTDAFTVYISGIDTFGPVSTVSRTDVNMLVTVNPKTKTILMTSIPRDYYVTLASFGAKDKLTHSGLYGINESVKTLENLFGIEINYYARVNFTSLVTMVDALGGITVYNDEAFNPYTKAVSDWYYPVGNIDMDGQHALYFVRERYHLSGGDRARVKNQQKVLAAMLNKMMSPAIIYNYSSVLNAVSGSFQTNMTSEEINSLIQMQIEDMASWNIIQISVDGANSTSTTCYSLSGPALFVMEPDMSTVNAATEQINQVING